MTTDDLIKRKRKLMAIIQIRRDVDSKLIEEYAKICRELQKRLDPKEEK